MRQKLVRFNDIAAKPNILEEGKELFETIRGKWNKAYFKNDNDIVLELGCGRGEYTISLAKLYPEKNFIGIDIKGDRMWVGSSIALQNEMKNVAFLRTLIHHLENFFNNGEVSEIWITFPDPRPKGRDERRRLTCARFLKMYLAILKHGGIVHLKTDNTDFFNYSLEVINQFPVKELQFTYDLYNSDLLPLHQGIQTNYENIFTLKGETIKYLSFKKQQDSFT
jgi:tRNA (guanine-N7-)-methyltransferase